MVLWSSLGGSFRGLEGVWPGMPNAHSASSASMPGGVMKERKVKLFINFSRFSGSIRCRRRLRVSFYTNLFRERLTIGPYSPVFKIFLLPDGNGLFQGVNQPATGLKSLAPMGRGHHNQHAGFAN